MQNVLITGGTGLIGSTFIERFHAKYRFWVLTRQRTAADRLFSHSEHVTLIHDLNALDNLDDFDIVINLAGEPIAEKRWSVKQKRKICQSRWELTHELSQKINDSNSPPTVFISGSAIGYYGRQNSNTIDEECAHCYNEFSHRLCQTWEQKARLCDDVTRVCLLRTGIVLDAEHGALKKMLLPYKMGFGGRFASGSQYMSWIHIDDMVRGIDFLINNDQCRGAYNLTAPNAKSNRAFSRTLANVLNRPNFTTMPAFMLKLMFGEMADLFLFGQNVYPKRLLDAGFKFTYSDLEPALASLVKK
ncbi:TIGR01777 family oxidoreductase [Thalassotalea maritima]|uniref:TIGR01777 family oxidoreductase n=1 Tax=Thalassotalea maritima TaxID=3242416 RepID=UPI00352876F2